MLALLSPFGAALLLALAPTIASLRVRRYGQAIVVMLVSVLAPVVVAVVLMATLLQGMWGTLPAGGLDIFLLSIWIAAIGAPVAMVFFLQSTRRFERISSL